MFAKVKDVLINLDNVKTVETQDRFVVFHFIKDPNPTLIPFKDSRTAKKFLEGFFILSKSSKNKAIDTTLLNLN